MSRSRFAALPLALVFMAGAGCSLPTDIGEICLHSEGCDGGGNGWNFSIPLSFGGLVTSAPAGQPLAGVAVRIEAPSRGWSETVLTDSIGRYGTLGLPDPKPGDCAGLFVTFSREGFQLLRITDFPLLTCGPGYPRLNASLTPNP